MCWGRTWTCRWRRRLRRSHASPPKRPSARRTPPAHACPHLFAYLRLGRYKDVLEVNKDAAASDERYLAANPGVQGPYPAMYYPHNVHFEMTAALMAGQGEPALKSADKLARLIPDEAALAIPGAQPIKQAPYFIHAQFSDPQTILALPSKRETATRGRLLAICPGNRVFFNGKGGGSGSESRRHPRYSIGQSEPARSSQRPRPRHSRDCGKSMARSVSRDNSAPAFEVIEPPSNAAATVRPRKLAKCRESWLHSSAWARSPASGNPFWRKNFR